MLHNSSFPTIALEHGSSGDDNSRAKALSDSFHLQSSTYRSGDEVAPLDGGTGGDGCFKPKKNYQHQWNTVQDETSGPGPLQTAGAPPRIETNVQAITLEEDEEV